MLLVHAENSVAPIPGRGRVDLVGPGIAIHQGKGSGSTCLISGTVLALMHNA